MYHLAPGNERLLSTHPQLLAPSILISGEVYYRSFSDLLTSLKTDGTGCEAAFGQTFFDLLQTKQDLCLHFQTSMGQNPVQVLEAYDFAAVRHLVDVGAGNGEIASALLQRYPQIQLTLFDLPQALGDAQAALQRKQLSERCMFQAGDFLREDIPAGGDIYLLSRILHDWDDAHALQILTTCRQAMTQTSKLLLLEFVVDGPLSAREALEDLFILVVTGGQERTLAQFRAFLTQADLRIARVTATKNQRSIIEAVLI